MPTIYQGGDMSLRSRIVSITIGTIVVIGVGAMVYVWFSFRKLMKNDIERVGVTVATIFSREASPFLIGDDIVSLNRLVDETKRLNKDISYVLVVDKEGKAVAHTFTEVPSNLMNVTRLPSTKKYSVKAIRVNGGVVHDVSVPILGGTLGIARIGFTERFLTGYLKGMLKGMGISILVILLIGIIVSIYTARSISRPILHLVDVTDRISMGETDVTIDIHSKDEIGKLAEAIRRMAASIKIAIKRLT
jgi:HAMP domain-containing protein